MRNYKTHIDVGDEDFEKILEIECSSEKDKIFLENLYKFTSIKTSNYINLKTNWFVNIWLVDSEFISIQFLSLDVAKSVMSQTEKLGKNIKHIEIMCQENK